MYVLQHDTYVAVYTRAMNQFDYRSIIVMGDQLLPFSQLIGRPCAFILVRVYSEVTDD